MDAMPFSAVPATSVDMPQLDRRARRQPRAACIVEVLRVEKRVATRSGAGGRRSEITRELAEEVVGAVEIQRCMPTRRNRARRRPRRHRPRQRRRPRRSTARVMSSA